MAAGGRACRGQAMMKDSASSDIKLLGQVRDAGKKAREGQPLEWGHGRFGRLLYHVSPRLGGFGLARIF